MRAVRGVLPPFTLFRIYAAEPVRLSPPEPHPGFCELTPEDCDSAYAGPGAHGFAIRLDGRLASHCWFWHGERYRSRNYWPLAEDEAKLIGLATEPAFRGQGLAPRLVALASAEMGRRGFRRLYARIWHSNTASRRAFAKAGWRQHALVADFELPGGGRRIVVGGGG